MSKFIFYMFVLILPISAIADANVDAKKMAQELNAKLEDYDKHGRDMDELATEIKNASFSEPDKRALILGHYGEYVFHKYLFELKNKFREYSEKTGREFIEKETKIDNGAEYNAWLDRGEMDMTKCQWDFDKKQACDFPDGFEDYKIFQSIRDLNQKRRWNQSFFVQIDDKAANKVNFISFDMYSGENKSSQEYMYSLFVSINGTEYKYDEYYAWQNQEAADIRAGKFINVLDKDAARKYRRDKRSGRVVSPFEPIEWAMDTSKEWKSQKIPDSHAFSAMFDMNGSTLKSSD